MNDLPTSQPAAAAPVIQLTDIEKIYQTQNH